MSSTGAAAENHHIANEEEAWLVADTNHWLIQTTKNVAARYCEGNDKKIMDVSLHRNPNNEIALLFLFDDASTAVVKNKLPSEL